MRELATSLSDGLSRAERTRSLLNGLYALAFEGSGSGTDRAARLSELSAFPGLRGSISPCRRWRDGDRVRMRSGTLTEMISILWTSCP